MKTAIASFLLLALIPATSFAREPKANACSDAQVRSAATRFIKLNLDQKSQDALEIRKVILEQRSYDANGNEVTVDTVKWGFKTGEMSFETYSLELKLSSSTLPLTGNCRILSAIQSETVE